MRPDVRVTVDPIKPESIFSSVRTPVAGGIVSFIGTVRDSSRGSRVIRMELEAATDLARADLRRIAAEAGKKFEVSKISVVHRIGELRVGDIIVAIAVSAPHRSEAFKACRFLIDELKKSTPIWKKEFSGKKGRWVGEER